PTPRHGPGATTGADRAEGVPGRHFYLRDPPAHEELTHWLAARLRGGQGQTDTDPRGKEPGMIVRPVVDKYAEELSSPAPPWSAALVADTEAETELPAMMVGGSLEGGEFLASLVSALRPRRILEIGTFTGYSALCMAQTMPDDAELHTCELSPLHASIARKHFAASPLGRTDPPVGGPGPGLGRGGPARPLRPGLRRRDKPGTSTTTRRCCRNCPPHADPGRQRLQFGGVANERDQQPDTVAMRAF
ncbi:hypothetical protein GTV15_19710, partial [Streptomyces sp. SID7803]|nr:hypothetical protein [Streptomyces sp. SID7803]